MPIPAQSLQLPVAHQTLTEQESQVEMLHQQEQEIVNWFRLPQTQRMYEELKSQRERLQKEIEELSRLASTNEMLRIKALESSLLKRVMDFLRSGNYEEA